MRRWFKKKTWTLLLCSLLIVFVMILLAETLVVKVKTTNLRKEPAFYAATIAALKAGDTVEKVAEQAGWYQVKTATGVQGWVHSSAVSSKSFDLMALLRGLCAARVQIIKQLVIKKWPIDCDGVLRKFQTLLESL